MSTATRKLDPHGRSISLPKRRSYLDPALTSIESREESGVLAETRRLVAECFGAFALTFVAAGGEMIAVLSGGEVSAAARAVAPGLTVMAMIYALGASSGAHFNPAVTLAFTLRGAFSWTRLPGYVVAQLFGATIAALSLRELYGNVNNVGATMPKHGDGTALVMEIILTMFLVTVILGTATKKGSVGPNAAIAVGATISLCGLFAAPVSGASMNPARSFGPALVGDAMSDYWIYLLGPIAGALLATALIWILRGHADYSEQHTATGDGED